MRLMSHRGFASREAGEFLTHSSSMTHEASTWILVLVQALKLEWQPKKDAGDGCWHARKPLTAFVMFLERPLDCVCLEA